MAWFIDDLDQTLIRITDGSPVVYDIPKFAINRNYLIEGDILYLIWSDYQTGDGGKRRQLPLNYLDVVDSYSGYIDNPTSASDLAAQIDAMIISGWTNIGTGGGTLVNKGDIMSHNGASDEIFPLGTNEFVHVVDTTESTGHKYVAKSVIVDGGLSVSSSDSLEITKTGASISGRVLKETFHAASLFAWQPVDGTTVYFSGSGAQAQSANVVGKRMYPAAACLLTGINLMWGATSTAGSNENISVYVRVNDTTDYLVATVGNTNADKQFINMSMNAGAGITLATTDFWMFKCVCPTWAANPTSVQWQGTTYFKLS